MIPTVDIWKHLIRKGQQDLYRSLTDEQRKAYDAYVQQAFDQDSKDYIDGIQGCHNPSTLAFWEPRISLPEWISRGG